MQILSCEVFFLFFPKKQDSTKNKDVMMQYIKHTRFI